MHFVRETVMLKVVVRAVTTVLQRVKGHYSPDPLGYTQEEFIYQPQGTQGRVLSACRSGVCRASTCSKQSFHVADVCPL
jgi:hypothetical protein